MRDPAVPFVPLTDADTIDFLTFGAQYLLDVQEDRSICQVCTAVRTNVPPEKVIRLDSMQVNLGDTIGYFISL